VVLGSNKTFGRDGNQVALPTRLLTVADHLGSIGGSEIAQLRVVEGLAASGWAVELLYVSRGDCWPQWNAIASSTQPVPASGLQRAALVKSTLGSFETATKIVRSEADIVYLHNPGDLPAAELAARVNHKAVVLHLHLPPPSRQPAWLNYLIGRADAVITPSVDAAERWMRIARLAYHKVSVIPTGVDTGLFAPVSDVARDEQRRSLGIDPGAAMILYAGRLDPTKGLHCLIEAMHHLKTRATLVMCGGTTDESFVKALHADSKGMEVIWVDRRLDVRSLLASADLLVLPSLVAETQGMVVIEAMSCGTPAVASAVGGLRETLSAFPDHLVPPGDAAALTAAIDRLVSWRARAPSLGDDSRKWVLGHRELDRTIRAVSALLAGVR
jgi:glycosyltransferase involved in cell wall biosynthesis